MITKPKIMCFVIMLPLATVAVSNDVMLCKAMQGMVTALFSLTGSQVHRGNYKYSSHVLISSNKAVVWAKYLISP